MPTTSDPQTIAGAALYRAVDPQRAIVSSDWEEAGSWQPVRPVADTWWFACSFVATVDAGIEGEVRLVATDGPIVSTPARIVSYVGPVLVGWIQVQWPALAPFEQFARLEARRSSGTGGGITILEAELTQMTAPDFAQRGGPTYPPGYDPGELAPYPVTYSQPEPYGG